MKKIKIFYSWQSDLPAKTNRVLIEEALNAACADFRSSGIEIIVDADTRDVSGSPLIAEVIAAKIKDADLFIADLSIVGELPSGRSMPNPNVLIELGYAMAALGGDRLVLVVNTHFGSIGDLPFDIKHRRVAPYSLSPEEAKTKGASKTLSTTFSAALKNWLRDVSDKPELIMRPAAWDRPPVRADAAAQGAVHRQDAVPFIDLSVQPSRSLKIIQGENLREMIFSSACDDFPLSMIRVGSNGGNWAVRPRADSVQMDEGEKVDFEFWRLYLDGDFHSIRRLTSRESELGVSDLVGPIIQMHSFLPIFYRKLGMTGDESLTVRWRVSGLKGRALASQDFRDMAAFRFAPKMATEDDAEIVETISIDDMDKNAAEHVCSIVNRVLMYFDYYQLGGDWNKDILRSVRRYKLNGP